MWKYPLSAVIYLLAYTPTAAGKAMCPKLVTVYNDLGLNLPAISQNAIHYFTDLAPYVWILLITVCVVKYFVTKDTRNLFLIDLGVVGCYLLIVSALCIGLCIPLLGIEPQL